MDRFSARVPPAPPLVRPSAHVYPLRDREDYNYPPLIKVIHFHLGDVEDDASRKAVRVAHWNYIMSTATFFVNFLGNFVLACGGVQWKVLHVFYSLFNLIIYSIVGMYSFYNGYKGLATQNGRMTTYYVIIQALSVIFFFAASIASGANYNGWTNVSKAEAEDDREMSDFWVGWTYFESLLWTVDYIMGGLALYWVFKNRKDRFGNGWLLGRGQRG